jgi:DNA-binding NtrC family response regulator
MDGMDGTMMQHASPFSILIVDDEQNIRSGLAKGLLSEATVIDIAASGEEALTKFQLTGHPLVIVDVRLNGSMSGIDLLKRTLVMRPQTSVIVITAHGSVEMVQEAMDSSSASPTATPPAQLEQPVEINSGATTALPLPAGKSLRWIAWRNQNPSAKETATGT